MTNLEEAEIQKREQCISFYLEHVQPEERDWAERAIRDFYDFLQCLLEVVCAEDLYAYADWLRSRDPTEEEWKQRFSTLEAFFEKALSGGYIARNPMKRVSRGIPQCLGRASAQGSGEVAYTSRGWMDPKLAESIPDEAARSDDSLQALYFPYARSFDTSFLKACLLVYDKLWFLDPLDRVTRGAICLYRDDGLVDLPDWGRLIEVYDELYEAGFVRIYSDFSLYREYDNLLSFALDADRRDPVFVTKATAEIRENGWSIHKARLPVDSEEITQRGRWERRPSDTGPDWYRSPPEGRDCGYGTYQDFSSPYIMNIAHDVVHPVVGFSATLNQTLLTCALRDITPITDSRTAMDLLYHKYQRAWEARPEGAEAEDRRAEYDLGIVQLGLAIVRSVLPKEELSRRTFGDLLKYRRASRGRMRAFQVLVRELRAEIESNPWTASFQSEIRRVVDKKIRPAELELRSDLKSTYEKMFGQIIGAAVKSLTPSAILTVLPGISLGEALVLGATVGTGLAAISIQPLLDAWAEIRSLKRNGLAWLLEVR